jgi:hypothetical protein
MGAYEELIERLRQTDVMQQVLAALEKEPVTLLYAICKEYEASNEPVPDHRLPISGYLKEVALRTLLSGKLLERQPGGRLSVYSYRPTSDGMECYRRLVNEGWGSK